MRGRTLGVGLGGVSATSNLAVGVDWRAGWSAAANLTYGLTQEAERRVVAGGRDGGALKTSNAWDVGSGVWAHIPHPTSPRLSF